MPPLSLFMNKLNWKLQISTLNARRTRTWEEGKKTPQ